MTAEMAPSPCRHCIATVVAIFGHCAIDIGGCKAAIGGARLMLNSPMDIDPLRMFDRGKGSHPNWHRLDQSMRCRDSYLADDVPSRHARFLLWNPRASAADAS